MQTGSICSQQYDPQPFLASLKERSQYLAAATSAELIQLSRCGDEDASATLYQRYVERLKRLANRHLSSKYNGRLNSDDVVQSIFRTVWRVTKEANADSMQFKNETEFWKWLVTVGLNKIYKKIRDANAAKRSVDREISHNAADFVRNVTERAPLPNHAAEVADLIETILKSITPMEQDVLRYRLAGYSQIEIADKLNVDPRTIRRCMHEIRRRSSAILDTDMPRNLD